MTEIPNDRPAGEEPHVLQISLLWRDPRLNVFCSLFWLPVAWTIASWAPWLGQATAGIDEVVNVLAPLITFSLIAWNLFASVRLVHRSGHTLSALPLTAVQILLFTLLFFQYASHLGANQYTWEASPSFRDWVVFAMAHAARATDMIDGIEAYGLHIQSIRNVGHLASLTLILYHLIITVFFISLFVEWVNRFKRLLWSDPRLRTAARAAVIATAAVLVASFLCSAFVWPGWRWADIVLWPLDNAARVVDFLDVLEVYQQRFHKLPLFAWEATLTFACRLLMAILLAGYVGRHTAVFRLRWLAGFALDASELEDLRDTHPNLQVRAAAEKRLARLKELATELHTEHRRWFTLPVPLAAAGVVLVFAATPFLLPGGEKPAEKLAELAIEASPWAAERALSALERMGSGGVEAVPILAARQGELPLERRLSVIKTLGFLGPAATEPLEALLDEEDSQLRLAGVAALRQVGPAAAPALIRGFGSVYPEVSEACVAAIRQHGTADAQRLADNVDPNNVVEVVRLLDDVDPYWQRRTSDNPAYAKAISARRAGRVVAAGGSLFVSLPDALADLRQVGPMAAGEMQPLEPLLFGNDPELSSQALEAYLAIDKKFHASPTGQRAYKLTVQRLLRGDPKFRRQAAEVLARFEGKEGELGQELLLAPQQAIAALRDFSRDAAEPIRRFAAVGLLLMLSSPNEHDRGEASTALSLMEQPAQAEAAELLIKQKRLSTPQLVSWCADENLALRGLAFHYVGQRGGEARDAFPHLAGALCSEDETWRQAAMDSLVRIDPECHQDVAQILASKSLAQGAWTQLLKSSNSQSLGFALKLRPWLGLQPEEMIGALVRQLRPEDSPLQEEIAAALTEVDPEGANIASQITLIEANQADKLLLFCLRHADPSRQKLGELLAENRESAAPAIISQLFDAAKTASPDTQRAIVRTLVRFDRQARTVSGELAKLAPPEQAPRLVKAWLTDSDGDVRRFGVLAAGQMGPAAGGVVEELFPLLGDADAKLARAVLFALERIDRDGKLTAVEIPKQFGGAPIAQLVLTQRDPEEKLRAYATLALSSIDSVRVSATPPLVPLLKDESPAVRSAAGKLLSKVDPEKLAAAEASVYEDSLRLAEAALQKGDRAAAGRALEMCPDARRGWQWQFLKRQADGTPPVTIRAGTKGTIERIGFTSDSNLLVVIDNSQRVMQFDATSGVLRSSMLAQEVPLRSAKPPKPVVEKPEKTKSEAALRAEELAQQREAEKADKAEASFQAKIDKLNEQMDRAMNIADFRAQDLAMNRIQAQINTLYAAKEKADAIAAAKADAAYNKADAAPAAKDRAAARERPPSATKRGPSNLIPLTVSPDGERALFYNADFVVSGWDVAAGKQLYTTKFTASPYPTPGFCLGGQRFGLQNIKQAVVQISLFDATGGAKLRAVTISDGAFHRAILSPSGERMAVFVQTNLPATNGIRVWQVEGTGEPLVLKGSSTTVERGMALSRNGLLLAAHCNDFHVRLWNTDTGEVMATLPEVLQGLPGLAFSPDDQTLAFADARDGLWVYDLTSLKPLASVGSLGLGGESDPRRFGSLVEFSPDGKWLAVEVGGAVRVWAMGK